MPATIVSRTDTSFTVQIEVPYSDSMLGFEEGLQDRLNQAGVEATAEGLRQFDTDGSPITLGTSRLTTKGQVEKDYQTLYGVATIARHVYQGTRGGPTYCPLDRDARIVASSTPKFAKTVAHKYAEFSSARLREDLQQNHGRSIPRGLARDIAEAVACVAQIKQEDWSYALPKFEEPPASVGIGLDGTCLLMTEDGWREAMVGTIGLYDEEGERQAPIYLGATPECGKAKSLGRMEREIARVEAAYPQARYVGLADGARGNWEFLGRHTEAQVIDFWHAAGYLSAAGDALFADGPGAKKPWLGASCHRLKHEPGAARQLIGDVKRLAAEKGVVPDRPDVEAVITYFTNQSRQGRVNYAGLVESNVPIGSGVTEAACKVLVKQRPCGSGMKWKEPGAAAVLSLRCLTYTTDRWTQFWGEIDQYGFPMAA